MNVQKFREADERLPQITRGEREKFRNTLAAINKAAAPEHVFKNIGVGFFAQAKCSCGWKGRDDFWGRADLAMRNWRGHVRCAMGLIAKECPCGKSYLPADGGPCHKLVAIK